MNLTRDDYIGIVGKNNFTVRSKAAADFADAICRLRGWTLLGLHLDVHPDPDPAGLGATLSVTIQDDQGRHRGASTPCTVVDCYDNATVLRCLDAIRAEKRKDEEGEKTCPLP